jgi:hypothetical protein
MYAGYYNHAIGQCTIFRNIGLCWIPKNCSSTMRFLSVDWQKGDFRKDNLKKIIILLRDPLSRWISGVTQFAHRNFENFSEIKSNDLNYTFSSIELDEHTVAQWVYISDIPAQIKKEFYLLEDNGLVNINEKYKIWNKIPKKNLTDSSTLKRAFKEKLKNQLVEEGRIDKIYNFYKKDYELIKNNFPNYNFLNLKLTRI